MDTGCRANVSSSEFGSAGFLDNLRNTLKDPCLNPCYLELELTETVIMQFAGSAVRGAGRPEVGGSVGLGIDDFGTGYSQLELPETISV